MVPGVALEQGRPQARLVRVARSRARRQTSEQLGQPLRRPRVDLRRDVGPVLPAPVPAGAAGSELGASRGRGRLRRRPAVLARPGRGRVPDRCRARAPEARGSARHPAARRCAGARPAVVRRSRAPPRHGPAGGPRRLPPLAARGRPVRRGPVGRGLPPRPRRGRPVRARAGRSPPGPLHPLRQDHLGRRGDPAHDPRGGRTRTRALRVARRQPRRLPPGDTVRRRVPRTRTPHGLPHPAPRPSRRPLPVPGRRARSGGRRGPSRGRPGSRGDEPRWTRQPRRRAHADPVDPGPAPPGVHDGAAVAASRWS